MTWPNTPDLESDADAPRVEPVRISPVAQDVAALRAEAATFLQDWPNRTLRVGLVADLSAALGRTVTERDRLVRRVQAVMAVAAGASIPEGLCGLADATQKRSQSTGKETP